MRRGTSGEDIMCPPGTSKLDFLESVYYLMKVKDEVCSVGHKKSTGTVETSFQPDY